MRISLALALVLVSLSACGGNQTDAAPPSSPSATPPNVKDPDVAPSAGGEGSECGDDVAIQKKCAPGLTCAPKPNAPISEHTPGICKKP